MTAGGLGTVLGAAACVISLLDLVLGWAVGIGSFVRIHPAYPAMVPETAAVVLFGGAGAIVLNHRGRCGLAAACGIAVLGIVVFSLTRPIYPAVAESRDDMSIATTICSLLLAVSLLTRCLRRRGAYLTQTIMDTCGLCLPVIALLGYIYDARLLFSNPVYTSMALNTALSFLLLFTALLLAQPHRNWIGILQAPWRGSEMARRTLPVLVLGPVVFCGVALMATRMDLVTADFRLTLLAFSMIATGSAAMICFAYLANASERRAAVAEEALRQSDLARQTSEIAAARAQKIEALGNLVGGVAHDFNNGLAVIMGNLELLKDAQDSKHRDRFLKEAIAACKNSGNLTRQLLAYGRKSRLDPEPVVADKVLASNLSMFRRICPADIRIELNCDAPTSVIEIDIANFHQSILNVLINARDAMPRGGTLTITSRVEYLERDQVGWFNVTEVLPVGDYLVITIQDTGKGMAPETLARATEPFYTTKGVGEGTGLGLSMVSGFCRQSGGGLRIESEADKGVTVSMVFPVMEGIADADPEVSGSGPIVAVPKEEESPVPATSDEPVMRDGSRILVIDDEPAVTRMLAHLLRSDGHSIRVAFDAEQALGILAVGPLPDLVLTDLVMPGRIQGAALADLIRRQYPEVAVLFMSGYESARNREGVDGVEGFQFLQKPIERGNLRAAIARALGQNTPSDPGEP